MGEREEGRGSIREKCMGKGEKVGEGKEKRGGMTRGVWRNESNKEGGQTREDERERED